MLPAALAVCERERLDGVAFLTALALGFEVSARIARTAVGLETVRGFHNPGTQGPFGAAAAVGKLYGFDAERLTDALGIAGSSSAGLLEFAWSGGDTKRLHLGRAAQLGLESALLARQGVRGPATVLEGRYGYFNAFSTPPRLEKLVDGLGAEWAIEPPSLKSYATHVTQQAVVQAIQDLKREHPLEPGAITRVVISGAPRIMEERHAAREPHDVLGGQYSLPFTAAVALTRDMSNPLVYDADAVADPIVRGLARRIELVPRETASHDDTGLLARRDRRRVRRAAPHATHATSQGLAGQSVHLGRSRGEVSAVHGLGSRRPAGGGHRRRGRRARARDRHERSRADGGRRLTRDSALRQAEVGPILLLVAVAEEIEQSGIGGHDDAGGPGFFVLAAQSAPGLAIVRHLDRGPALEGARELLALAEFRDGLDRGAEPLRRLAEADHAVGQARATIARGLEDHAAVRAPGERDGGTRPRPSLRPRR